MNKNSVLLKKIIFHYPAVNQVAHEHGNGCAHHGQFWDQENSQDERKY